MQNDVNNARSEADPCAAERHLTNIVQQPSLAEWFGQTGGSGSGMNGRQVSLIVRMQVLEHPPGELIGE